MGTLDGTKSIERCFQRLTTTNTAPNLKLLSGDNDMPRGPKGEKRPADVIGAAVMIGKIVTGEIDDLTTDDGKNAAAVALGRMGGKARAAGMSAKKRKAIAKKAAAVRWKSRRC